MRGTAGFPTELKTRARLAEREGAEGEVGGVHLGTLKGRRPADGSLQTIEADRCSHKEQRAHTTQRTTLEHTKT